MSYVLTIAGHDPVHGAGISADLATWAAMGLDGASVVTALTVQNSHGLQRVEPVSHVTVREALQAVLADGEPAAVKIGMLGSAQVMREVANWLAARRCPVVLDPVLSASNGQPALGDLPQALHELLALMRHVDVITPNVPEAAQLLRGRSVTLAALRGLCRSAVVLKGGHEEGAESLDRVFDGQRQATLRAPRLPLSSHGTGCVFSAVLAGAMAQGWDVFDAATEAKLRVHAGMAQARARPGRAQTQTQPSLSSAHMPSLQWQLEGAMEAPLPFAPLIQPLGFYPVVPDVGWLERLLQWGVRTVQLRIKSGALSDRALADQIDAAVGLGHRYPAAQVFINDHWQHALRAGAYGVHLGQQDIDVADMSALRAAGLRLGLSSHTPCEMARAHALQPSYVAIGPIYPTTLKAMPYDPVGLQRLRAWARWYQPRYPVVAIGGISLERARDVLACGVDSVAVVSAVTQAADPAELTRDFLRLFVK